MNRRKVFLVHIPKTGGTYLLNRIYNIKSIQARHVVLTRRKAKKRHVILSVRDPVEWYTSLWNFYPHPNHPIRNRARILAQACDDPEKYVRALFDRRIPPRLRRSYQGYHACKRNIGYLTYTTLHYLAYRGNYSDSSIRRFLTRCKRKYNAFRMKHLEEDLLKFAEDKKVKLFPCRNAYKNKNERRKSIVDESLIARIRYQDRIVPSSVSECRRS